MRMIVRQERAHPRGQLTFTDVRVPPVADRGWRLPAIATGGFPPVIARTEGLASAHALVEDRIRCGMEAGIGRFPSRHLRSTEYGWSSR